MAPLQIVPLGDRVSYVPSGTNVGLWEGPSGTVLIDSGNDAEAGRRLLRALEASGRSLAAAFLTHSNADHSGGAAFLASRAAAPVYASRLEAAFCADPIIEPSFLWGAFPPPELRGKFFVAPPCAVVPLAAGAPPPPELAGAEIVDLAGHFFSQIGLLADGVLFAGDAVFGPASIEKHPVFFVHDVAAFLASLDRVAASPARIVLPGHGEPAEDAAALAAANRRAVERVASAVRDACASPASWEDALAALCARFGVALDWAQYALIGSTVRSYLTWLRGAGELESEFLNGRLLWRKRS